jgi:hypothetical protein
VEERGGISGYFTDDEVAVVLHRVSIGRAPRLQGLPVDIWKRVADRYGGMVGVLRMVFNELQKRFRLPADWKRGRLTLLFKGGD